MILGTIQLIWLASHNPFLEKSDFYIEVYHHLTIVINQHIFTLLTNTTAPLHFRSKMAWVMIIISLINITLSVLIMIATNILGYVKAGYKFKI